MVKFDVEFDRTTLKMYCGEWGRGGGGGGGGASGRRCWGISVPGVLLMWILVGQGPIVLPIGAGRVVLIFFLFRPHFSFLSSSLSVRRLDKD